jgi:type IV secretory pathway TraG/TraD family ATPase VirD4
MENSLVAEMFSKQKTDIDMMEIMEKGKVLLIDTSIKRAGEMGSSFIGRFFISLVTLASQERDVTRPLRPVFFYIDEAATYLGENIESILERSRESRVGLTLAHQQMQQLSPSLQASVLTNTSTKYIGTVNEHDARTLAGEMLVDASTLQHQDPLHFHIKVKGLYKRGLPITVEAGRMEKLAVHPPPATKEQIRTAIQYVRKTVTPTPKPSHIEPDDELG